jgi:hypothetical protein
MNEWISIKDRQPIEGREVLIIEQWADLPIIASLNAQGLFVSDKSHIAIRGDARLEDMIGGVTHWMPLPELPAREVGGDK